AVAEAPRAQTADEAPAGEAGTGDAAAADGEEDPAERARRERRESRREFRERRRERRMRERMAAQQNGDGEDESAPQPQHQPYQPPANLPSYSLTELKRMRANQLLDLADTLRITDGVARMRKQDVTFAILKVLTRYGDGVAGEGVLEILPDG